jgi:ACS family hexuronate transporter-like MFS transporter
MTNYRWTVCALVFAATTINYLDRSVISLLKPYLEREFHWSETDYSTIVICFQVAYAAGMAGFGRIIDKVGVKIGYAAALLGWSLAAIGHALARGTFGFGLARAALGASESGNFPAANKTIAEWFPKKDRAFATGIYNSGSNVGAIAAPLSVPWMAGHWGWGAAFAITGAIGLLWLVFWLACYDTPARMLAKGKINAAEHAYIHSDDDAAPPGPAAQTPPIPHSISTLALLARRQTWAFIIGKFLTDPIWWFFLFWLPAFLKAQYHLEGTAVSLPVAFVYTISTGGALLGGWLPRKLISAGFDPGKARKITMLLAAIPPLLVLAAQPLGHYNMWWAIVIICIACAAHHAWSANIFITASDMFPKRAVASVTGLGGMAGAVGGILIARAAGVLFDHYKALGKIETGYGIMFAVCATAYIVAWLAMHALAPRFTMTRNL